MAVAPFFGPEPSGPAWEADLRPRHVITALDGESPPKHGRALLVWWRQRTARCAAVTLTVRDGQGAERALRYAPR